MEERASSSQRDEESSSSSRRSRMRPPVAMYSMRTSMPHFVSALRVVDDWKRQHAKRAEAIAQAEYDMSAKFVKSPFARSLRVEELVRFVDDTQLDIDFMVQLPSIEKCLERWWHMYARGSKTLDQDQLRTVFYDLATVLVEAKTENIHKNSVSMIVRGGWTKWSPKEPPLSKDEFFRLLFILAHLMTTSNRLNDYVVFLQETLGRITRVQQSKAARSALRQQRQPKSRRKLSVQEIMAGGRPGPIIVPLAHASQGSSGKSGKTFIMEVERDEPIVEARGGFASARKPVVSVTMSRILSPQSSNVSEPQSGQDSLSAHSDLDNDTEQVTVDTLTEVLECASHNQGVHVNRYFYDQPHQEKWEQIMHGNGDTNKSINELVAERSSTLGKFSSPMVINRLRASRSVPVLEPTSFSVRISSQCVDFSPNEEEVLRRSLSRVTLKGRIARNKMAASPLHDRNTSMVTVMGGSSTIGNNKQYEDRSKPTVYLAIST